MYKIFQNKLALIIVAANVTILSTAGLILVISQNHRNSASLVDRNGAHQSTSESAIDNTLKLTSTVEGSKSKTVDHAAGATAPVPATPSNKITTGNGVSTNSSQTKISTYQTKSSAQIIAEGNASECAQNSRAWANRLADEENGYSLRYAAYIVEMRDTQSQYLPDHALGMVFSMQPAYNSDYQTNYDIYVNGLVKEYGCTPLVGGPLKIQACYSFDECLAKVPYQSKF